MLTITSKADLDQYCREIKQFPRLAGDQEMRSLATCIVAAQEQRLPAEQAVRAKHRLVEAHLGLVLSLAYHYAQLVAQGEQPTRARISQLAHVDGKRITAYKQAQGIPLRLTTRRPLVGTAQERLDRALAQLEAQDEQVTKTRLEQLAGVASKTSGAYLRAYRAGTLTRG